MQDKHPKIYKQKINSLKSDIQKEYYYHGNDIGITKAVEEKMDREEIINKLKQLLSSPNYIYKAGVIIMLKNGDIYNKNIISYKDNYILTLENDKINIDDIYYIK